MILLSGSKAWSQVREVNESTLRIIKGQLDKKDSLIAINESIVLRQSKEIENYEKIVVSLNEKIALEAENCILKNRNTVSNNTILRTENKKLRRQNFFLKAGGAVLTAFTGYILIFK